MRLMTHHRVIRPLRSLAAWMLFVISLSAFLAMESTGVTEEGNSPVTSTFSVVKYV